MPREAHMPAAQMQNVLHSIPKQDGERLKQLAHGLGLVLGKLGVKPSARYASKKQCPEGSDHFDSGSLIDWAERIGPADKEAIHQLLTIHATVIVRMG